jgi:hypothetical protein|tara:strand:+ start:892 stop:1002 length:111 start_codon:yes stop_codon:yes gene_type:complete
MMGLFLSLVSFVIGFIYRNIRESDLRKMGKGADPGT